MKIFEKRKDTITGQRKIYFCGVKVFSYSKKSQFIFDQDKFQKECKKKGKLNLGCGSLYHEDWVQLDFTSSNPAVYSYNLLNGIPCVDNSVEIVYHSHVLEHFSKNDAVTFMQECYRVLKPGGILRVAVPDLEIIVRTYLQKLESREIDDYNWIMLEMYDQSVRNVSGGDMLKYLQQEDISNIDFVLSRIGNEGEKIIENYKNLKTIKTESQKQNSSDIGKFRLGGEIHQWMYDKFSLEVLFKKVGFKDFTVQRASSSFIPNFNIYPFDILDNKIRKPDSIFVEGIK